MFSDRVVDLMGTDDIIISNLCHDLAEYASDPTTRYYVLNIIFCIINTLDIDVKKLATLAMLTSGIIEKMLNISSCGYELEKMEVLTLSYIVKSIIIFDCEEPKNIKQLFTILSYTIQQSKNCCKEHIDTHLMITESVNRCTLSCIRHFQEKVCSNALNYFLNTKSLLTLSIIVAFHDSQIQGKGLEMFGHFIVTLRYFLIYCSTFEGNIVREIRPLIKFISGYLQSKSKNGCTENFLRVFEPTVIILNHFVTHGSEIEYKTIVEKKLIKTVAEHVSKNPINKQNIFSAIEVIKFADSFMKLGRNKGVQESHDCENTCNGPCNSKFNLRHMKPLLEFLSDAITFEGGDKKNSQALNLLAIDLTHKLITTNKIKGEFVSVIYEKGLINVLQTTIIQKATKLAKGSLDEENEVQNECLYLLSLETLEVLVRNYKDNGNYENFSSFVKSITHVNSVMASHLNRDIDPRKFGMMEKLSKEKFNEFHIVVSFMSSISIYLKRLQNEYDSDITQQTAIISNSGIINVLSRCAQGLSILYHGHGIMALITALLDLSKILKPREVLSPFRKKLSMFSAMIENPMAEVSKLETFSPTKITSLLLLATAFTFDQMVAIDRSDSDQSDTFHEELLLNMAQKKVGFGNPVSDRDLRELFNEVPIPEITAFWARFSRSPGTVKEDDLEIVCSYLRATWNLHAFSDKRRLYPLTTILGGQDYRDAVLEACTKFITTSGNYPLALLQEVSSLLRFLSETYDLSSLMNSKETVNSCTKFLKSVKMLPQSAMVRNFNTFLINTNSLNFSVATQLTG